jgi:hypothetical protein
LAEFAALAVVCFVAAAALALTVLPPIKIAAGWLPHWCFFSTGGCE